MYSFIHIYPVLAAPSAGSPRAPWTPTTGSRRPILYYTTL